MTRSVFPPLPPRADSNGDFTSRTCLALVAIAALVLTSLSRAEVPPRLSEVESRAALAANDALIDRPHEICPCWSPKAETIAFQYRDATGNYDIYTVRPDGTELRRLTLGPSKDGNVTWSPDGTTLLFHTGIAGTQEWDIHAIDPSGANRRLVTAFDGRETHPTISTNHVSASAGGLPAGALVYQGLIAERRESELFVLEEEGPPRNLTRREGFDGMPHWFPDGIRILYTSRFETNELMVLDVETGRSTRLTTTPTANEYPHGISEDGRTVFYWAVYETPEGGSQQDLFSLDLTSGAVEQLTDDLDAERCPSPSPDNSRIAFGVDDRDVAILDLATGKVRYLGIPAKAATLQR